MDAFPPADRSPRAPRLRRHPPPTSAPAPLTRLCARLACAISALLLLALAGSAFLLFWAGSPATPALAATTCPTGSLPPTPTSGSPLDPSSIKLNEILTNPTKDWNCDGKADGSDQWIELINTSGSDESLFGLQLGSQGKSVLLSSSYRIAAYSYLIIFSNQIPTIPLSRGSGQLDLLDGSGTVIDAVNYPALGTDQSYARSPNGTGQWQVTTTPTPGAANVITSGSSPTPTPTATSRSGGGGSSSPTAPSTPIGSVVIPTDASSAVALQNQGGSSPTSTGGTGTSDQGVSSWLKIALIALIGAALLGVIIWYFRTWRHEPEGDN
jgi:hypothetical protein